MSDTECVEPVLWLLAPLVVTLAVATVLLRRNRTPDPAKSRELQREQLARIEEVLRPTDRSNQV